MTKTIDLNSDLGEAYGPWAMGDDAAMLDIVNSANIACGGHASDPDTMLASLRLCVEKGVSIGAHPGYADPLGFGRRVIPMTPAQITAMTAAQIGTLGGIAALAGARVSYVKPHGALNNFACVNRPAADAIAAAIRAQPGNLALLAVSGTELESAGRAAGIPTFSEIFADRGYTPEGLLVPRGTPGAMIHDPAEAAARILQFLDTGLMPTVGGDPVPLAARSICVHGDSTTAVAMARDLRAHLTAAGISLTAFA
ncbi:LamB/YcsF family protein [Pseudooceanicola sp. CBS1P-1]|uniref:5-oxoprolinase subunit PxpA n=1 Tax=Pseudooceanicola albus TaxID=2692189 RepID=A0A6L7FYR9_9RHOB|nr:MULTISPECIES: 5-oxoprolinase subunit PxpA [Pseudooceanicola]MBT9384006.1 LamB/YcsF family protein [Pseudooceanicola endophyticus]MXN16582.1 5-oxoprolinase subunit PxpA [Pseudooceanicola albus]